MKPANSKTIRKEITFCGNVQGIDFRWRAQHAAYQFKCTGWIRIGPRHTVIMEIQGEESHIDQVIRIIEKGAYGQIEKMESRDIPLVTGREHSLKVL